MNNDGESTNPITTGGYTYDLNGNITAMPAVNGAPAINSIAWDVFDRASSVTTGSSNAAYKYDAIGRRIYKWSSAAAPRYYFYEPSGRLLAQYDGYPYQNPQPSLRIEYFAGQRIGQHTDRLGSVRYASGWKHYYPYGEELTSTASDTYKFAELYRDSDTGLDYALARYGSSAIGRFLSVDSGKAYPTAPQSWNRYAYSGNDPINFVDPKGLNRRAPGYCYWMNGIGSDEQGFYFTGWSYEICEEGEETGGIGPPPEETSGGDALDGLQAAVDDAVARLKKYTECAGLYGLDDQKMDAATLLQQLANGGGFGAIAPPANDNQTKSVGDNFAVTLGTGASTTAQANYYFGLWYDKTDILVNASSWNSSTAEWKSQSLLHELGHVFNMLKGAGGSQIVYDADPKTGKPDAAAQKKNSDLLKKCGY